MENENEDLIVEVPEDKLTLTLADDDNEIVAPEKKPEIKPEIVEKSNDDAIEALRAQIKTLEDQRAADRTARERAEVEARRHASEASEAAGRADEYERSMTDGWLAAAQAKRSEVKQKIRAAVAAGDEDAAEDLRMEAATIASRLVQYEDNKRALQAKAETKAKEVKPEPRRQDVDPVDAMEGVSEPSKNWLRSHRECITDAAKNAKLLYGHHEALGKGIRADSTEYFEYLDTHMGYREAKDDTRQGTEDRRTSMVSAPVSRDTRQNGSQLAPGKYKISREEVEMAEALGMTPTEYVTNKLKAEREGRYANH